MQPWLIVPAMISTVGFAIMLAEIDTLIQWLVPLPQSLVRMVSALRSENAWEQALAVLVLAPLREEFFFRGLILRGSLSRYRVPTAILISALLFAAAHLNPWQFASAACLGALFAWWFQRTRSLFLCVLGHMAANGIIAASIRLPFRIKGFNTDPINTAGLPWSSVCQPLWFDALGLALAGIGIWAFRSMTMERETRIMGRTNGPRSKEAEVDGGD